jgi:hypothetical protein
MTLENKFSSDYWNILWKTEYIQKNFVFFKCDGFVKSPEAALRRNDEGFVCLACELFTTPGEICLFATSSHGETSQKNRLWSQFNHIVTIN